MLVSETRGEREGTAVRVLGRLYMLLCIFSLLVRLVRSEAAERKVVIEMDGSLLCVSTSLVVMPFRVGSIYEFLGEIEQLVRVDGCFLMRQSREDPELGSVMVVAKHGRCVDGLDVVMFKKALEIRRKYLETSRPIPR